MQQTEHKTQSLKSNERANLSAIVANHLVLIVCMLFNCLVLRNKSACRCLCLEFVSETPQSAPHWHSHFEINRIQMCQIG